MSNLLQRVFREAPNSKIPASVSSKSCLNELIENGERERFLNRVAKFSRNNPYAKVILAGLGATSLVLSFKLSQDAKSESQEIERRKKQLSKDVYELSGEEAYSLPWNSKNVDEWLHRPVKITGRPIHSRTMFIPRTVYGHRGYDYVVPLVTKENEDFSDQHGVLLNKGWIPAEFKCPSSRTKLEDAKTQTFVGYVSRNDELGRSFFGRGNSFGEQEMNFNYLDFNDLARGSELVNQKNIKVALVECVDLATPLDERNHQHYEHDSEYLVHFPYKKTRAGALQLKEMPWDSERKSRNYFTTGLVSTGISALLFLLK